MDFAGMILSLVVFFVYGSTCIISVFFTFSLEKYLLLEEKLKFNLLSPVTVSPLDIQIDFFDRWAYKNNKIIGPLLILLSVVDFKLVFDILKNTF